MYEISKVPVSTGIIGTPHQILNYYFLTCMHLIAKMNPNLTFIYSYLGTTLPQRLQPQEQLSDAYSQFAAINGYLVDAQRSQAALYLWNAVATILFTDHLAFCSDILTDLFDGNFELQNNFLWLNSHTDTFMQIIQKTIQVGTAAAYLSTAGVGFTQEDESLEDISNFFEVMLNDNVICSLRSDEFFTEFQNSTKVLITMYKNNNIARFMHHDARFNVFQINHEWMRGMWALSASQIVYHQTNNHERASIQANILYLNNLISQAPDHPIGYPAYVSPILHSYFNPISYDTFV
jgi:hypothetical protein